MRRSLHALEAVPSSLQRLGSSSAAAYKTRACTKTHLNYAALATHDGACSHRFQAGALPALHDLERETLTPMPLDFSLKELSISCDKGSSGRVELGNVGPARELSKDFAMQFWSQGAWLQSELLQQRLQAFYRNIALADQRRLVCLPARWLSFLLPDHASQALNSRIGSKRSNLTQPPESSYLANSAR